MQVTTQEASRITCFVIMPSGNHGEYEGGKEESDFIYYDIITPAAKAALGPEVVLVRETDSADSGAIDKSIVRKIAHSDYAIVDVTGQNPNVFFELGMRYVFRSSRTVLIRQEGTKIPFDIAAYRHVDYKPKFRGIEESKEDIADALAFAKEQNTVDSLVYDTFPNLRIDIPAGTEEGGTSFRRRMLWEGIMPWSDYWKQLETIVGLLADKIDGGLYQPDALIGLSNGGMMAADLMGRKLFRGTPVLSLWANRWDDKGIYFDNPINTSTLDGLIEFTGGKSNTSGSRILLVDDIVASGTTIKQAIAFVSDYIDGAEVAFTPLFSRNPHYAQLLDGILVWNLAEFSGVEDSYIDPATLYSTTYPKLPYEKEVRST